MSVYLKTLTAGCSVAAVAAAALWVSQDGTASSVSNAGVTQGMVAVIDQESGQLRAPTAAEARNYQSAEKRSNSEMKVVRRADGSESMKLDDSYMTYSIAERNEDGSWSRRCSLDHDHALHMQKAVK